MLMFEPPPTQVPRYARDDTPGSAVPRFSIFNFQFL